MWKQIATFLENKKNRENNQRKGVRQDEIEKINQVLNSTNSRLGKLEKELEKAVSGYKIMLIKNNPDVLPDLIVGDSVESVDHSLVVARELTARIREQLEQKLTSEHIPSGAPVRAPPNTDNLNSYEKILYGLKN